MVQPEARVATHRFHMIQFVEENQRNRSPSPTSRCKAAVLRFSRMAPPWPWTMAFGIPVVPDEYTTQSACENGTGANASGAGFAIASPNEMARGLAGKTARHLVRRGDREAGTAGIRASSVLARALGRVFVGHDRDPEG